MAPRTAEQFEVIRNTSRKKIHDAALFCFSRYGFHGCSMNRIASQAGVSKGLLYNYYKSKADLLKNIMMGFFERSMKLIQHDPEAPARRRLEHLVRAGFELMRKERETYRLLLSVELQPGVLDELGDFVDILKQRKVNAWEGILRELEVPDPELTGKVFASIIGGASLSYIILEEGEYELKDIEEYLIKTYCNED